MYLPTRPAARRGLSLLEVLVALTIFLLSFVAIGRLVTIASDQALDIQQHSQATRLAQSKLNEVICGALPLQSSSGSFDEDPDWHYEIEADQEGGINGLWTVSVTVTRSSSDSGPDVSSTLTQMVLDPSVRGSAFDQVTVTGTTATGSSSQSSPSSQSSTTNQSQQQQQTPAAQPQVTPSVNKPGNPQQPRNPKPQPPQPKPQPKP